MAARRARLARSRAALRSIKAAVRELQASGHKVAQAHLRYLNPWPLNTGDVVTRYRKVLIPENNLGQLLKLVRAEFLVDASGLAKVAGAPFKTSELTEFVLAHLQGVEVR